MVTPVHSLRRRSSWAWGFFATTLIAAAVLASCAGRMSAHRENVPEEVRPSGPLYPGTQWAHAASPEAVGFSSAEFAALRTMMTPATTGMIVVAAGQVVFEYGDTAHVSYIASVRKSVLAMLFGRYVADGTIRLDRTLREIGITDHGGPSAQELEATIADLLAARSGVYHPASNGGDSLASALPRGSQRHGTYFLYSNWDFNALGTIFEHETGRNLFDALETDLAQPIGMQDFVRARHEKSGDLTRSIHPAYHMHLSTRDMARIGYLMLREGRWAGHEVVPRTWVRRITTPVTWSAQMNPVGYRNGPFGYGFLWWVFDGRADNSPFAGAYTGMGVGGQFITVLPKLDVVVAHKVDLESSPGGVPTGRYLAMLNRVAAARFSPTAASSDPQPYPR